MKRFYEYLISIDQNWIKVNNEGVILTSSEQCYSKLLEWTGIYEISHLQKNTLYKIEKLIEKEEEKKCTKYLRK